MGNKKKRDKYTSKGQRRNVARSTIILMRKYRKEHKPLKDILKRLERRTRVINKPTFDEKKLRQRYIEEEYIESAAYKIYMQYKEIGITWSACVQAIKTNYVEQLHNKWSPRLKEFRDSEIPLNIKVVKK